MTMHDPEKQANGSGQHDERPLLADLFWRDEILQVMYWYQGEGFGSAVTARDLRIFLSSDEQSLNAHLERMVTDGYLERVSGAGGADDASTPRYSFTEHGAREGARRFADEFADLTKQAHGDCPPNCPICRDLPPEECAHCHPEVSSKQYAT